jgi:hypothetical protein
MYKNLYELHDCHTLSKCWPLSKKNLIAHSCDYNTCIENVNEINNEKYLTNETCYHQKEILQMVTNKSNISSRLLHLLDNLSPSRHAGILPAAMMAIRNTVTSSILEVAPRWREIAFVMMLHFPISFEPEVEWLDHMLIGQGNDGLQVSQYDVCHCFVIGSLGW